MNSRELVERLKVRYQPPEWYTQTEVSSDAGYPNGNKVRRADFIAFNVWPSRGFVLHGFEIKVSRSDVQAELRDVTKSDAIQRFCDFWWLVVSDKNLISADELPKNWGLMIPRGNGLKAEVKAPKLNPCQIPTSFFAVLLRRSVEQMAEMERKHQDTIHTDPKLQEAFQRGAAYGESMSKLDRSREERELTQLRDLEKLFLETAGISLDSLRYDKRMQRYLSEFHIYEESSVDLTRHLDSVARLQNIFCRAAANMARIEASIRSHITDCGVSQHDFQI